MHKFVKSFIHAVRGLKHVWAHELNFRIEIITALLVIAAGLALRVDLKEFIVLILVIGAVIVLELLNSSFELMIDFIKPSLHEQVGIIKDMLAGAVLISSIAAAVIGALILLPNLIVLFF